MYTPGFSALKRNVADWPGATWVASPPASGPVTACRSMLWLIVLSGAFVSVTCTSAGLRRDTGGATTGWGRRGTCANIAELGATAPIPGIAFMPPGAARAVRAVGDVLRRPFVTT